MIILSQDGKEIINFDNVNLIRVQDDGSIVTYDNTYNEQTGVSSVLGKYETEKRAKEILREIVEKYSSYLELKGGVTFMQGGMNIQPNIFNIPKVYEMPGE